MSAYLTRVIDPKHLKRNKIEKMHQLYLGYYSGVTLEQFERDIHNLNRIIILEEKQSEKPMGFLGMGLLYLTHHNKKITIVFGGKTVLDRQLWKSRWSARLQSVWAKEMFLHYLKHISQPHYMYGSPTGYRTYLLFAGASIEYWPCWYQYHPDLEALAHEISVKLYGDDYDAQKKIVIFHSAYALKEDVSDITPELIAKNPGIKLFSELNPDWAKATGLPFIARVDLKMLLRVFYKKLWRGFKFFNRKTKKHSD